MGRPAKGNTRQKIMRAAERLFAKKGYDGTSMEDIARSAKINKPLIYYYFKSKIAIKEEIFKHTIDKGLTLIGQTFDAIQIDEGDEGLTMELEKMISFISGHKEIVKIMLMESMKEKDAHHSLLTYADILINHEIEGIKQRIRQHHPDIMVDDQYLQIHEFFTGFIPVIMFVVLREKFAAYFHCDQEKLLRDFLKAFLKSHMASHKNGFIE
jgi:AcrR family transcriptional regulator